MKMEIVEKKTNPLQCRTEVRFVVDHAKEPTPGRNAVAEEIAKQLNTRRDCVVVDGMAGKYGIGRTAGYAKVYDSKKDALDYENDHLLKRNGIAAEAPKGKEGGAPAAE